MNTLTTIQQINSKSINMIARNTGKNAFIKIDFFGGRWGGEPEQGLHLIYGCVLYARKYGNP